MSAQFQGHAELYGISPDGKQAKMGVYAMFFMDNFPIVYRAKFNEEIGTDGVTGAFVWTNPYYEVTVSIRPSATASIAAAESAVIFAVRGAVLTLADFKPVGQSYPTPPPSPLPIAGSDVNMINGDWILIGDQTITLNRDDPATVEVNIRRYPDAVMSVLKTRVV